MIANKIYKTQELVLQVRKSFDPEKLKLGKWERFINMLCGDRDYQKEAIKSAIIYLASGNYNSIENLVQENARSNFNISSRYHSIEEYNRKIQLPNKLSATLDLATGTGKSFTIYGISQIALGLGIVDKVLVLCPSVTIREELTKKFIELATDKRLLDTIPDDAHWKNPRIINSNETIKPGDVCVTNIHAVYASNSSSIIDSLGFGKGEQCLVLSDEVHHVYNKPEGNSEESKGIKKWKEFLLDTSFGFRYLLGFTGTAYIDNDYFNDVIYRYSLNRATEERFIKKIDYVHKDESSGEHERFQKIYQNHRNNREKYPAIKPLTILVTRDIKEAKRLHTRLVEFLAERGEGSEEYISKNKVLTVTSHSEHKVNLLKLPYVDTDKTTEWIISVAMLTEGWDVKNVFQIVPMEERAFNSKLLIAQVLGRGLRLPLAYPQARVTVFNHDSWSSKIQDLVNEILEIEQRLRNSVILTGERSKFNFLLHNIKYDKQPVTIENPKNNESKTFNYKGYVELTSETFEHDTETTYVSIDGNLLPVTYKIEKPKESIDKLINKIIYEFETRDWEGKTLKLEEHEYTTNNLPPKEEIESLIRRSMQRVGIEGDYLGTRNYNAVLSTFNTLLRQSNVSKIYTKVPNNIIAISTESREHESISILSLRQNSTVFYTDQYEDEIMLEDTILNFNEVIDDGTLPRNALSTPKNPYTFKTPVDLVFVSHEPERKFIELLSKDENANCITAWVKSNNQNFYSIDYTLQAGSHSIQRSFNPDFFIKIHQASIDYIIVVETKSDNDDSDENKAKYRYAKQHFEDLNNQLKEAGIPQVYYFHFLSPVDYPTFFQYLQEGKLIKDEFYGTLEKVLNNDTL